MLKETESKREKDLFLSFLVEKVFTEGNLLIQEFFHLAYIFNYFSITTNSEPSTSMREVYKNLKTLLYEDIFPDLKEFVENISELKNKAKEVETKKNTKRQKEPSLSWTDFFVKYFEISRTKEFLLEHLDYLQKKTISLFEGFAGYYPRPKCFSVKEATKIHFFMERLTDNFKSSFYELSLNEKFLFRTPDESDKAVSIYWDFLPSIRFISTNFERLIAKTDFLTPQRQSYWIILFHEVIHHLLYGKKKFLSDEFREEKLKVFQEISIIVEESLRRSNIRLRSSEFEENLFTDLFVDWLLTEIFGILYVLPSTVLLFSFDDKSFFMPRSDRVWYIRLKTILSLYSPEKEPYIKFEEERKTMEWKKWREWSKEFKKSALSVLEKFKKEQIRNSLANPYIYLKDEIIISIVKRYFESFFKKRLTKLVDEIRNTIVHPQREFHHWLSLYIKYLYSYYYFKENLLMESEKEIKYKEGRALCKVFCDFSYFHKRHVRCEDYKKYFNLPVYHFRYIKFRYDILGAQNFENLAKEKEFHAWGLGSYTFLSVSKKESYEKIDEIICWEKRVKELKDYKEKGYKFYKEDWYLTLYEPVEEKEKLLKKIIENPEKYLFVFIKYQLLKHCCDPSLNNSEHKERWEEVERLFEDFKEKCEGQFDLTVLCFHFVCFEWFDFCTLIVVEPEGERDIPLKNFLSCLKEEILINNEILYRTETDIFIGKKIIKNVQIDSPLIHLRITSDKLRKGREIVEKLYKKFPSKEVEISSHFGIKDLSIEFKNKFTFEGLLEIVQKVISEREFSDVQILPYVKWEKELTK